MGLYGWLSEQEFESYSAIGSDKELNEIFQEVRELMPDVYVSERVDVIRRWWFSKPKYVTRYTIYHRQKGDGNTEVKHMNLVSSNKAYVANYLFGLFNGFHRGAKTEENEKH